MYPIKTFLMHALQHQPIYECYKVMVITNEEEDAKLVLYEFFNFFEEDSWEEHLLLMLEATMRNSDEEVDAHERANTMFFHRYIVLLLRAAKVISGIDANEDEDTETPKKLSKKSDQKKAKK